MPFFQALARGTSPILCSSEDVSEWLDDKQIAACVSAGFLERIEKSTSIACPACGEHMAEPEYRSTKNGEKHYVVKCDDPINGVFDIQGDYFSYKVDFAKIAQFFAKALKLKEGVMLHANDLYRLGAITVHGGTVRVFLLLSNDLQAHKDIFEESSKSASTIVLTIHTPPVSFIDSVATLDPTEILSMNGKKLTCNTSLLEQTTNKVLKQNSYRNGTLSVRGVPIADFTLGSKEDISLTLLSSESHMNTLVSAKDILANYNANSQYVAKKGQKTFGADQWCHQLMSDIRAKCTDANKPFVDIVLKNGGRKTAEVSLIFNSLG